MIALLACASAPLPETCPTEWYADLDGDGFGTPGEVPGPCDGTDWLVDNADDCDDTHQSVHPDAVELCNAIDDDCDGTIDGDAVDAETRCPDADGDSRGDAALQAFGCVADFPQEWIGVCDDCDDTNAQVNPLRWEECDDLDVDEDCNGIAEDEAAYGADDWYIDADGDGYGAPGDALSSCDPIAGSVVNGDDCNDADASVFPFAPEICDDAIDSDCDGGSDVCGQLLRDLSEADARYATARAEVDLFGESAFGTGDLTGDGAPDVGVTAPGNESQPVGVYIFDGTLDGDFDSAAAAAFVAGNAISAVGGLDFDGDGIGDLATGHSLDGGAISVHAGPLAASGAEAWSAVTGGSLGLVIAPAGDLDGDGRADLLVGAQRTDRVARVLTGLTAGTASADDFPSLLGRYDEGFADAVLAMDSDGDGLSELLVRAGGVLYGVDPPLTEDLVLATDTRAVEGAGETGMPGNGLANVGDWDGDGDDDLAVATQGRMVVLCASDTPDSGVVADHAEFTLTNDARHAADSTNVQGGDFDGDDRPDVVVTAEPLNMTLGTVVLPGPRFGTLDWSETNTILVGFDASRGGKTLAAVGDTDLDGIEDWVISSPSETGWNGNQGAAWLFRGGDWVRP